MAYYSPDIGIDLLGLLGGLLVYIEVGNIGCELSLHYSDSYLPLDSDTDLRGASSGAYLLYILYQPVIGLDLTIPPPEV